MSYEITVEPDVPIIQAICLEGFKLGTDMIPMVKELRGMLDAAQVKHHVIFDIEYTVFNLDEILKVSNIVNQPDVSIMEHPMLGMQAIVTTNKILLAALKGMNSPAFRHFSIPAFPSRDEAVAYLREQIAAKETPRVTSQ